MEKALELIEQYGLSVVLLIGCLYALYKFFFFSIREVKNEFSKRHETLSSQLESIKKELSELKEKINLLIDRVKNR